MFFLWARLVVTFRPVSMYADGIWYVRPTRREQPIHTPRATLKRFYMCCAVFACAPIDVKGICAYVNEASALAS